MKEMTLKYGCNPNQKPASVSMKEGELPFEQLAAGERAEGGDRSSRSSIL